MNWFNANEVEPEAPRGDVIPNGEYRLIIEKAEEVDCRNPGSKQLSLQLSVIEGEHQGRKVFDRIHTANSNEKAVSIGRAQLAALCRSANAMDLSGPHDLVNKVVTAKVVAIADTYKRDQGEKDAMKNEIKGWIFGAPPAQSSAPAAPAAAGDSAAAATPAGLAAACALWRIDSHGFDVCELRWDSPSSFLSPCAAASS